MDRFEEIVAEMEGLPSPAAERAKELALLECQQSVDMISGIFIEKIGISDDTEE